MDAAEGNLSAPAPVASPPSRAWWRIAVQLPVLLVYLLVTSIHAGLLAWLFVVPRYRRERLAARLTLRPWLAYTRLLLQPRLCVVGREHLPTAPFGHLFVANHESAVDVVVLVDVLRAAFLMKKSLLLSPIGWGGQWIGCVGVDRRTKASRARALRATLAMATRAQAMIVFPEGTFGHADGRLRAPHLNLLRAAYDAGLTLVPVGHAGTRRALDGEALPFRRGASIAVVIGEPLVPRQHGDREVFAAAAWRAVAACVADARRRVPPGWPYELCPTATSGYSDPSGGGARR